MPLPCFPPLRLQLLSSRSLVTPGAEPPVLLTAVTYRGTPIRKLVSSEIVPSIIKTTVISKQQDLRPISASALSWRPLSWMQNKSNGSKNF